jgi:hypothetical protein
MRSFGATLAYHRRGVLTNELGFSPLVIMFFSRGCQQLPAGFRARRIGLQAPAWKGPTS